MKLLDYGLPGAGKEYGRRRMSGPMHDGSLADMPGGGSNLPGAMVMTQNMS